MGVANAIAAVITSLVGLVGAIAAAIALLRNSGYGRNRADAAELEARAGHQRVLLKVIRRLRDVISGCPECTEPDGIDDEIKWDFGKDKAGG